TPVGLVIIGHSIYKAFEAIDSKDETGKMRKRQEIIDKQPYVNSLPHAHIVLKTPIGDFPLGVTDANGLLRIDVVKAVSRENLFKLLDADVYPAAEAGTQPMEQDDKRVAIQLKTIVLSNGERIMWEKYEAEADPLAKTVEGEKFLENFPNSIIAGAMRMDVKEQYQEYFERQVEIAREEEAARVRAEAADEQRRAAARYQPPPEQSHLGWLGDKIVKYGPTVMEGIGAGIRGADKLRGKSAGNPSYNAPTGRIKARFPSEGVVPCVDSMRVETIVGEKGNTGPCTPMGNDRDDCVCSVTLGDTCDVSVGEGTYKVSLERGGPCRARKFGTWTVTVNPGSTVEVGR
ncbi:MAG: hypothetical protein AAB592_00425, partial [Patescibacteria group bacterium]